MAEGDTILRLAQRIEAALAGEAVAVRAPSPRGRAAGVERLDGMVLAGASARGKHLLIDFGDLVLHSHLAMSGGWHLYRRGERWRRPEKSAWAVLSGPGVEAVQFGGPTLRLLRPEQVARDPALARLGPDILAPSEGAAVGLASEPFALEAATASLIGGDRSIALGEALLDQSRIAGIGNIFKSEACFAAAVDPWRRLTDLEAGEAGRVLRSARTMMFACVDGVPRPREVYRRAGEPCRRCRSRIMSRGQGAANRTTYWCPGCQR